MQAWKGYFCLKGEQLGGVRSSNLASFCLRTWWWSGRKTSPLHATSSWTRRPAISWQKPSAHMPWWDSPSPKQQPNVSNWPSLDRCPALRWSTASASTASTTRRMPLRCLLLSCSLSLSSSLRTVVIAVTIDPQLCIFVSLVIFLIRRRTWQQATGLQFNPTHYKWFFV